MLVTAITQWEEKSHGWYFVFCIQLYSDERSEYANLQAIIYGPYLLVGHTTRDWDIKVGSDPSTTDWITPIPASYNSQLSTFSQVISGTTFALTYSNQALQMQKFPEPGTELAPHATFRLSSESNSNFKTQRNSTDTSLVMLEPYDLPGKVLMYQGAENGLVISDSSDDGASSVFNMVSGLDGQKGTISLESKSNQGCYVSSTGSGSSVKLSCKSDDSDDNFNQAASFIVTEGVSKYNPISFVAKGTKRNFVLEPLYSFRDETYTAYFNLQAWYISFYFNFLVSWEIEKTIGNCIWYIIVSYPLIIQMMMSEGVMKYLKWYEWWWYDVQGINQ